MPGTRTRRIGVCLVLVLLGWSASAAATERHFNRLDCELPFARSELFFGSAKPDGTAVTDAEFAAFLDGVITPRFPDGLTLLTGLGQFRLSSGVIIEERSFLLILLYPKPFRSSSVRIEEIRELYKAQFQQESVLRVDSETVRVCF